MAHYATLGIQQNASAEQIRSAFRQLAMVHHPDKGGKADKFREISEAYLVLSDTNRRAIYDRGADPNRLFKAFLANTPATITVRTVDVQLTLEKMFVGGSHTISVVRKLLCSDCKGHGGTLEICQTCEGRGRVQRPTGLPIFIGCGKCTQRGFVITQPCAKCREGFVQTKEDMQVVVPPQCAQRLIRDLPGRGDQNLHGQYGLLRFCFVAQPHARFRCVGNDLHMEHTVSLYESLTGPAVYVNHLNGKTYRIVVPDRMLPCATGTTLHVPGLGWTNTGKLSITLRVFYPKTYDPVFRKWVRDSWPQGQRDATKVQAFHESAEAGN